MLAGRQRTLSAENVFNCLDVWVSKIDYMGCNEGHSLKIQVDQVGKEAKDLGELRARVEAASGGG